MKYRTLGKTNLKVSDIGIGTWQLANDPEMWVGGDLNESVKALYKFVELGGNFIDTAWVYGYAGENQDTPTSEELIGKFLAESKKRDDLVIATKVGPKNWKWPALKHIPFVEVFPTAHVESQVNESLTRLGVDFVELVQFHVWQDDWADIDEWKEITQKLTKQGKVKHWGISANDYQPSNCLKTLDTGLISTIQFIFNIFHQKPTEKLLPYAKKNNIGLIARVPLDEGGLSGNITRDRVFSEGDFRNNYFKGDRQVELAKRVDDLKELMVSYPEVKSVVELAMRYILTFDAVSTVIPGMREVRYVEQNVSFSDKGGLSAELLAELKNHVWERNFYSDHDPWLKASNFVEA